MNYVIESAQGAVLAGRTIPAGRKVVVNLGLHEVDELNSLCARGHVTARQATREDVLEAAAAAAPEAPEATEAPAAEPRPRAGLKALETRRE